MTNDKRRMTKESPMTNDECVARGVYVASAFIENFTLKRVKARAPSQCAHSSFGLRYCFVIRHSGFVIS